MKVKGVALFMTVEEMIQNISINLKKLRKEAKLTQEELIRRIGEENISLRSYKTYESGKSDRLPLLDKLILLADYYKCPMDYIVFGKTCTYDDSFLKKDDLRRLICLIYSLALRPVKETNPNSDYYGKYLFISNDDDIHMLMDEMESRARTRNITFYKNGEKPCSGIDDMTSVINKIPDLDEDWRPTLERYNYLLVKSNINPEDYFKQAVEKINKETLANKIKQQKKA